MKYVLDASVALKWVPRVIDSAIALKLRSDFEQGLRCRNEAYENRSSRRDEVCRAGYTFCMADLQNIIRSVHDLSPQEKLVLRNVLDRELAPPAQNGRGSKSELVGLFAGEQEILDEVMDAVYEGRGRPWRAA